MRSRGLGYMWALKSFRQNFDPYVCDVTTAAEHVAFNVEACNSTCFTMQQQHTDNFAARISFTICYATKKTKKMQLYCMQIFALLQLSKGEAATATNPTGVPFWPYETWTDDTLCK